MVVLGRFLYSVNHFGLRQVGGLFTAADDDGDSDPKETETSKFSPIPNYARGPNCRSGCLISWHLGAQDAVNIIACTIAVIHFPDWSQPRRFPVVTYS
jgi:hypothetical protein